MDVIGIDAEAFEIVVNGNGVSIRPWTCCYLDVTVDPTTRLISAGVNLFGETNEGKEQELSISFEDPIPHDALPPHGEIGVDLRDLLDPRRNLDQVVGMAIAQLFALDAELVIACDDPAPNERSVVELRLRVGRLYEEAVGRPYGKFTGFIEPVESPGADAEILRKMDEILGPLPGKS